MNESAEAIRFDFGPKALRQVSQPYLGLPPALYAVTSSNKTSPGTSVARTTMRRTNHGKTREQLRFV